MDKLLHAPSGTASRPKSRGLRNPRNPRRPSASCLALLLAAPPVGVWAKNLDLSYTMALPAGAAHVSVVSSDAPIKIQEYLLLNLDKDLLGQVTVDKISALTLGDQTSPSAHYDVELYLTGKILPLSTQQFNSGQSSPLFNIGQAPVQYRYVLHQLVPGQVNAMGCYDYVGGAPCALTDLIKGAERSVLNTETNGLTAAVFSWSGRPYTAFDITQVTLNVTGKIDHYQITPGLLKKTPVGIPLGDTAFNARSFQSMDALVVDGDFTNRAIASFDNQAELTINGSFTNLSMLKHGIEGNLITNNGTFLNASAATLKVAGWFVNGGKPGAGAVFNNDGLVSLTGDSANLDVGKGAALYNSGKLTIKGGGSALTISGSATNQTAGVIDIQQGLLQSYAASDIFNAGTITIQKQGQFTSGGHFTSSGLIENAGLITNQKVFRLVAGGGLLGNGLVNTGTVTNAKGGVISLEAAPLHNFGELTNAGTLQFSGGTSVNLAGASITNTGAVALVSDLGPPGLSNQGKFFNNAQGRVTLAPQTFFENTGIFENNRGAVFQTFSNSGFTNTGSFSNNGGTVIIGGEFQTPGAYSQKGGSTVVNGSMTGNVTLDGGTFAGTANVYGNIVGKGVRVVPGNPPGGSPNAPNPPSSPAQPMALSARSLQAQPPGALVIDGELTLEDSVIEIGLSADGYSFLDVTGAVSFTNTLVRFVLQDGFLATPQSGQLQFNWLSADTVSPQSWAGLSYAIGSQGADGSWTPWQAPEGSLVDFADGHLVLVVTVPEPGAPAMLLSGLAALCLRRQGRPAGKATTPVGRARRRPLHVLAAALMGLVAGGAQALSADSSCRFFVPGLQPCLEARSSAAGSATVHWDDGSADTFLAAPDPTMQLHFGSNNALSGSGTSYYSVPGGLGARPGGLGPSLQIDFARTTGVQGLLPATNKHYTLGHTNANFLHGGAATDGSLALNSKAKADFSINRAAIDFLGADLQPFTLDAANRLQPGLTGEVSQRVFGSAQSIWVDRVRFSANDDVRFDVRLDGTLAGAASSVWYVLSATDAQGNTQGILNTFRVGSPGSSPLDLRLSGVLHAQAGQSYALVGELYAFINVTAATAGPDGASFSAASGFYDTARITAMTVAPGVSASFGSGAAVWASITHQASPVQEPATTALMLAGLAALMSPMVRRRWVG